MDRQTLAMIVSSGGIRPAQNNTTSTGLLFDSSTEENGGHNLLQPLQKRDYSAIKFWSRLSWQKFAAEKRRTDGITNMNTQKPSRGSTRKAQGINVRTQYMEDETGIEVTAERAGGARTLAKEIFSQLAKGKSFRDIPPKWTQVSNDVKRYYFIEMYKQYPELRFCDDNWKARKLGSESYSPWYHNFKA